MKTYRDKVMENIITDEKKLSTEQAEEIILEELKAIGITDYYPKRQHEVKVNGGTLYFDVEMAMDWSVVYFQDSPPEIRDLSIDTFTLTGVCFIDDEDEEESLNIDEDKILNELKYYLKYEY